MSYSCDICDKTIKLKSKNKHLKSVTHKELEKSFRIIHSTENTKFFIVDDIYITILSKITIKIIFFYLVRCNFNLVFDDIFFPLYRT